MFIAQESLRFSPAPQFHFEMQFSILSIILLSSLRFSQASPSTSPTSLAKRASGGFQNSCIDITLVHDSQGYFLDAQCNNNAGSRVGASIKLGGCLTNNNGQLAYEVKYDTSPHMRWMEN